MRVADDPDLAGWISDREAEVFLGRLGVGVERPDLSALQRIVGAYLGRIPFQNVGMLARYGRAPTAAEIVGDMRAGRGGPCNVMNPFLAALLSTLGFDVTLVSGSMAQPDCHIALVAQIDGRRYWLDAGNGHPYLEPIALDDDAPRTHAGLTFRLAARGHHAYAIEHLAPDASAARSSYTFTLEPRPLRFFAAMIEQHHTVPGYGPFLTGLRLIRFPGGAMTAIRDDVLLTGRASIQRTPIPDCRALLDTVAEHFGDVDLPVDEALRALDRAGHRMFGAPA